MPAPKRRSTKETFALRLARARKARGLSQRDFARRLGISQRMVAYYEGQSEYAPTHLLPKIAEVLSISIEDLLGMRQIPSEPVDIDVRILRRIQKIQQLPAGTKRAVLKVIDDLLAPYDVAKTDEDAA